MNLNIKKTLLVTLDFPPRLGGVATYYYNVCRNLPADKIVVLAPEQEGAQAFDLRQNFTIIRRKLLNQFSEKMPKGIAGVLKLAATVKWMSLIKHIYQVAKNHKIELIAAGQILPIGTLALTYKKQKRTPYIFFAHGLDITLPQKFMRKKTLLKKIINEAKAIVANSHWTKDELIKLGAEPEKVVVAYPCPNLTSQQPSEWKIEEIITEHELKNKKIILTVGRLVERKGHDMVIKAMPEILKSVPNAIYLIVGDGPDKNKLENLVNQLSLRDHVRFLGAVPQKDLAAYYSICDVFIMPSRQLANGDVEGFGIVYLEANLFGKPVIGGNIGGTAEAIVNGKTGILVNPESTEDIAGATIELLSNKAYAERLGMQGLQRVSEEFDWQTQTEKIKAILK